MADDCEDDQWLYGEAPDINNENTSKETELASEPPSENQTEAEPISADPVQEKEPLDDGPPGVDDDNQLKEGEDESQQIQNEEGNQEVMEDGEVRQNGDDSDKEDLDDDSDDDVNVVIGDIKTTTPSYTALNIKKGGLLTSVGDKTKQTQQQQQQAGKFVVEEFEQIGTINGVPASEFNLDTLADKPWRKPGADITDYFNYGFNEDTWKAYCERQRRMRVNESGVGLAANNTTGMMTRGPLPIMNDNSKYTNNFLGTTQRPMMTNMKPDQPKINTIQVMTADRREYSRKPSNFPDVTLPPPAANFENFQPEYGFNPEPEPFYGGYEPTQDSQWMNEPPPGWTPTELKTLTGPPPMGPPSMHIGPPPGVRSPTRREASPHKDRDRDRERESRSRSEKPRDRERERSHRRERSRSRSRRHKSRSRSPSHRSHRKKKSRRHEDSD